MPQMGSLRTPPFLTPEQEALMRRQQEIPSEFPQGLEPIPTMPPRGGPEGPMPIPAPNINARIEPIPNAPMQGGMLGPQEPMMPPGPTGGMPQRPPSLATMSRMNPPTDSPRPPAPPLPGMLKYQEQQKAYEDMVKSKPRMQNPKWYNRLGGGIMGGIAGVQAMSPSPQVRASADTTRQAGRALMYPGYDQKMQQWTQDQDLAGKQLGVARQEMIDENTMADSAASRDYKDAMSKYQTALPELKAKQGTTEVTQDMIDTISGLQDWVPGVYPIKMVETAMKGERIQAGIETRTGSQERIQDKKLEGVKYSADARKEVADKNREAKDTLTKWQTEFTQSQMNARQAKSEAGKNSRAAASKSKPEDPIKSQETFTSRIAKVDKDYDSQLTRLNKAFKEDMDNIYSAQKVNNPTPQQEASIRTAINYWLGKYNTERLARLQKNAAKQVFNMRTGKAEAMETNPWGGETQARERLKALGIMYLPGDSVVAKDGKQGTVDDVDEKGAVDLIPD